MLRIIGTVVILVAAPGGLDKIAGPVDYVIGEALSRLKAHIETGDANRAVID